MTMTYCNGRLCARKTNPDGLTFEKAVELIASSKREDLQDDIRNWLNEWFLEKFEEMLRTLRTKTPSDAQAMLEWQTRYGDQRGC